MRRSKKKRMVSVEDVLMRLIVICITVLLLSQLLLLKEGTRRYLSQVDKMEGEDLSLAAPLYADTPLQITEEKTVVKSYQNLLRSSKVITIKMISPPTQSAIFIMINGKKIDDFSKGDRKITVYDGDYLEIDATAVNLPVQFVIKVSDKEFQSPQDGLVVEGVKKALVVGKIKFRGE